MRISIIWILILGFLTLSCDKDKPEPKPEPKDEIVFTDITPDIQASTIRDYYSIMNPYCGPQPIPNDSIATIGLDLNNDSQLDFNIEIRHYQQEINQYCGHCGIFHIKIITIKPLSSNGFVSIDTVSKYWIRKYDTTQLILPTDIWSNGNVTALLMDGCLIPYVSFDDTYWGLKLDDMIAWLHVERSSNNGLKIKELAINRTKGNALKPGKRK